MSAATGLSAYSWMLVGHLPAPMAGSPDAERSGHTKPSHIAAPCQRFSGPTPSLSSSPALTTPSTPHPLCSDYWPSTIPKLHSVAPSLIYHRAVRTVKSLWSPVAPLCLQTASKGGAYPSPCLFNSIFPQHGLERLVEMLNQSVCVQMVRAGAEWLDVKELVHLCEQL